MATTTRGVAYPVVGDDNTSQSYFQSLAQQINDWPGIADMTTTARNALAGGALWVGRTIYNTTTKQHEWYTGVTSHLWQPLATQRGEIKWLAYKPGTPPLGWLLCDGSAVSRTTYADLFTLLGTIHGTGDGSTTFNLPNLKQKFITGYDAADLTNYDVGKTGGAASVVLVEANLGSHTHLVDVPSIGGNTGSATADHLHAINGFTQATSHSHAPISGGTGFLVRLPSYSGASLGFADTGAGTNVSIRIDATTQGDSAHVHQFVGNTAGVSADHLHSIAHDHGSFSSGAAGSGTAHENRPPYVVMYGIIKF